MGELRVRFAEDVKGMPLALVDFPGLGAVLTPKEMRGLADALHLAADDCQSAIGQVFRRNRLNRSDSVYDF